MNLFTKYKLIKNKIYVTKGKGIKLGIWGQQIIYYYTENKQGPAFPGSSASKESTYNAGDPSLISGSGSSLGEGMGYTFQYSWASLVAQLVKNLPAMWETWVQCLGWEDPLEDGIATHSSILAWRIPLDRGHDSVTKHRTVQHRE